MDLGKLLLDAKETKVEVAIVSMAIGKKLKGKSNPRTRKQQEAEETFRALKLEVAKEWTAAASDMMRCERGALAKFHAMRTLTKVVMGSADYHPNPCILICPFCALDGKLNNFSAVSQLYSHWQHK